MIVVISQLHVRWQFLFQILQYLFQAIGNIQRAAVGLTAHIQQHGRYTVSGHHVKYRFRATFHPGKIPYVNRMTVLEGDRQVHYVVDIVQPAVHYGQEQRVVFFVHAGRCNQVVLFQRIGDLLQAEVDRIQFQRIDDDVKFRGTAADQVDARHSRDTQDTGFDVITGRLPQIGNGAPRTGKAHANNGKGGKG